MSGKTGFILALILGAVALAYVIGSRLSAEAINILVGVLCGIAASVPVSLGLLIALTRRRDQAVEPEAESSSYPERVDPYPPRAPQSPYPPSSSSPRHKASFPIRTPVTFHPVICTSRPSRGISESSAKTKRTWGNVNASIFKEVRA